MTDISPDAPPSRTVARTIAALLGTSALSLAMNGIGQAFAGGDRSNSFLEAIPPFLIVVLIPGAVGGALVWYAVAGWRRTPEPPWMRGIRWGSAGAFLWAFIGTVLILGYYAAILGRDAGLAPLMAFLSSPAGFILGVFASLRRRAR